MGNNASTRFYRDKSERRSRNGQADKRRKQSRSQSMRATQNNSEKVQLRKKQRSRSVGKSSTKVKSKSSQCSCCNKKYNFMDSLRKLYPPKHCIRCHREVCKKCYIDKCCHKCSTRERGDMRSITKLEEMDRNELVQILQNLHLGQKAVDIKETSELISTILSQCDMDKDFVREFETSHSKRSTPQNGRVTEVEINGDQHSDDVSHDNIEINNKDDKSNISITASSSKATVKTEPGNPYGNGQPRFVDTFDHQQQVPSNDEDEPEKTAHLKPDNLVSTEDQTPSLNLVSKPVQEIHLAKESTIRDESFNSLQSKEIQLSASLKQPSTNVMINLKPEMITETIVSRTDNSSIKLTPKEHDKMSTPMAQTPKADDKMSTLMAATPKADDKMPTLMAATPKADDKMPTPMAATPKADDKMSPTSTKAATVIENLILTASTSSKAEIQPIQIPQIIETKISHQSFSESSHDEADDKLLSLRKSMTIPMTAKSQDIFPSVDEPLKTSTPLISRAVSLRSLSSVKAIEEFDIKKLRQILDRALENVTEQEIAMLVTSLWRIRRKLKPKEQKIPVSKIGSLIDIAAPEVIPTLSIRQIKNILEKHQVTFADCSEKYEMVVKLNRLWTDMDQKAEEKEEIPKGDQCVICLTERANCVLLDCGHLVACSECVTNIKECPVCRLFIVKVIRVFKA